MKNVFLIAMMILTSNVVALDSIFGSPEVNEVIENAQYNIEASGELDVFENLWVETSGTMNCQANSNAEKMLELFEEIIDRADSNWKVKAKAWDDIETVLGDHQDYVFCTASTYIQYYDITWYILYRDGYKIAIEWASEN